VKKDTQAYKLLALVAMSAECSEKAIVILLPQESYRVKVLQQLQSDNLIARYENDAVKGFRLTRNGKNVLLQMDYDRFSFFLEDGADWSLRKAKLSRRLRQHRISEVMAMMQNCGITVWRDQKDKIFENSMEQSESYTQTAFFNSKEVKAQKNLTRKIINSKLAGVWVDSNALWFCYNMGRELLLWFENAERRADILIRLMLKEKDMIFDSANIIVFGEQMLQAAMCLADHKTKMFFLNSPFQRVCYIPLDEKGIIQMKILEDKEMTDYLNAVLSEDLHQNDAEIPLECDGYNENNEPVLICIDLDLKRLARFIGQLQYTGAHGEVICFDYQREAIKDFCGEKTKITEVDFEAIRDALFEE